MVKLKNKNKNKHITNGYCLTKKSFFSRLIAFSPNKITTANAGADCRNDKTKETTTAKLHLIFALGITLCIQSL
jgi:hypothetical protein